MKKIEQNFLFVCLMLCMLFAAACDNTESQTQITTAAASESTAAQTSIAETTAAETTVAEEQTKQEQSSDEEAAAAAEAQKKIDVVSGFTLDLNEEDYEFYMNNTFIELFMYPGLHCAPQLLIKNWEKDFEVHELTLEYDDPVYGKIDLCFTGARIHDIFM